MFSLATGLYWRNRLLKQPSADPHLNNLGSELLGNVYVLHQAIIDGRGRIKVNDGYWLVKGVNLPVGERVKVVGQDGIILLVEPVEQAVSA